MPQQPQKGDIRHGTTEDVVWDGSRWNPTKPDRVDNPVSLGPLDYIPGLRDAVNIPINAVKGASAAPDVLSGLWNNPGATLKGFAKGTAEAATPGRVGLLALLTGGATLPAALGAAGGEAVAQGTRLATDAPNAPRSFTEAAGNVLEAGSVPAVAAAINAVPSAVTRMGGSRKVGGAIVGGGLGAVEGYRRGGVLGALEGGAAGAAGGRFIGGGGASRTMRALQKIAGMGGDDAGALAAPEAEAAPMTKGEWINAREERFPFQKEELPYRMEGLPDQNPGELYPYQRDLVKASAKPDLMDEFQASQGPQQEFEMGGTKYHMDPSGSHVSDPRDPAVMSPSMRGLQQAIDPEQALKDAAVAKYLSDAPDSAFARLRAGQGR